MITVHRSAESGLETVDHSVKGCWIEVIEPGEAEVKKLTDELNVPLEFVTASLDPDEIPRVEKADGAILIVVRVPHFQGAAASIPYITEPVGIIVAKDRVVTLCRHKHELLRPLPHDHQTDLSTQNPTRFVLHMIWSIANSYLHDQAEIDKVVERVEARLQKSLQNREVLELLRYQKSLVHLATALHANETMLERLQRGEFLKLKQQDEDLLDDVFTENRQAMGATQVASDILSNMMDAFASIISNNVNAVMKFLASVTVILLIPQIVGAFYGMNVRLPIADEPSAFPILVGVSLLLSLIVGLIFRKKDWI